MVMVMDAMGLMNERITHRFPCIWHYHVIKCATVSVPDIRHRRKLLLVVRVRTLWNRDLLAESIFQIQSQRRTSSAVVLLVQDSLETKQGKHESVCSRFIN
jgi:hypothetical protein